MTELTEISNYPDIDSVQSTSSESNSDDKDCDHSELDSSNYCLNCGIFAMSIVPSYERNEKLERKIVKTLSDTTLKMGFPQDIINEANRILLDMGNKTKRHKKKKLLDFYCIYQAFNKLGITADTHNLANKLGLDTKDINTALSSYSSLDCKKSVVKIVTAMDLVEEYAGKIGFNQDQKEIITDILNNISKKDRKLKKRKILVN